MHSTLRILCKTLTEFFDSVIDYFSVKKSKNIYRKFLILSNTFLREEILSNIYKFI